jgi:hypothetical protein
VPTCAVVSDIHLDILTQLKKSIWLCTHHSINSHLKSSPLLIPTSWTPQSHVSSSVESELTLHLGADTRAVRCFLCNEPYPMICGFRRGKKKKMTLEILKVIYRILEFLFLQLMTSPQMHSVRAWIGRHKINHMRRILLPNRLHVKRSRAELTSMKFGPLHND